MKKTPIVILALITLAGCATNVRYIPYTDQRFAPKEKYSFVTLYNDAQKLPVSQPYFVIGRVEVEGYVSEGVNPDTLTDQAKTIARKKGADAIINVKIENIVYSGIYVSPGDVGRHYYHPTEYIPYRAAALRFRGELIVFSRTQDKG